MGVSADSKLDFGNRPVGELLWTIFVPTLVGMLFTALFLVVDGIFIGKGIGPHGLAAVNLFEPILVLYLGIGAMVGAGCCVQAAMDLSHGNTEAARACVTRAYILVIGITAIVSAILYLFPHTILVLVGATPTLEPVAMEYYRWFIPSGCFMSIQIAAAFTIRLDGSPKYIMASNIVATMVNLLLDYIFIFEMDMGMRGAAIATDIGTGTGVIMTIYYMAFLSKILKPVRRPGMAGSGRILKLGGPSFLGETSSGIVSLLGNIMFGIYIGDTGIAAFSIICYLTPIVYTVYIALSSSMQPVASFNHGCGKGERVRHALRMSLVAAAGFGFVISSVLFLFPGHVASIFLQQGVGAHRLAGTGLRFFAATYLFSGVNTVIITFFQSVERIRLATVLTILRCFVFITAAFLAMPYIAGENGLWLAVPVSEAAIFIICLSTLLSKHELSVKQDR